jgi:hypothetical protein
MGWNYRALREKLNKLEPRKSYTIHVSEFKTFKRGRHTAQGAVKAVKRAARNMNAEVQLRGDRIHIKLRSSCSCTA